MFSSCVLTRTNDLCGLNGLQPSRLTVHSNKNPMNENETNPEPVLNQQPATNQPSSGQATQLGSIALNESKAAAAHAWEAVKRLFADPINGQGQAFESLGSPKAKRAGLAMLVVFALSSYLLFSSLISGVQNFVALFLGLPGGLSGSGGFRFDMKLILFCIIPAAAIYLGYLLISITMSSRRKDHAACLYSAGITALPLTVWFLVVWIFGLSSPFLFVLLSLLCLSTTFIFIASLLRDIYTLNSRKTLLLTPAVIIVSTYASMFMYDVLM